MHFLQIKADFCENYAANWIFPVFILYCGCQTKLKGVRQMSFLDDKYLLESESAVAIYNAVKDLPVIDPHNHADVAEIAANANYPDAWKVFAATDHYVWEVMRKRGVEEKNITGSATPKEKWMELARVMPEIAGNPVFEWIHLDLRRRFGITDVLCTDNAERIWNEVNAKLATDAFKPLALLEAMNVEVMCSTDDPVDTLEYHTAVNEKAGRTVIRPTWRPDKSMRIHYPGFREYIAKLGERFGVRIGSVAELVKVLQMSHDYFAEKGCRASDHDTPHPLPGKATLEEAEAIFKRAMAGEKMTQADIDTYQDYLTLQVAAMDMRAGWVYQLHMGVVRDVRNSLFESLGMDVGGDVSEFQIDIVKPLCSFLNHFDDKLKIVLYCLEPCHQAALTAVARAFGKNVRLGSAWWLNDQPYGMSTQLEYIGNVDVYACFGGMVSDSRKILSYASRFEMFRRTLANVLGGLVLKGRMPQEIAEKIAVMMCYTEPKKFFNV